MKRSRTVLSPLYRRKRLQLIIDKNQPIQSMEYWFVINTPSGQIIKQSTVVRRIRCHQQAH
jgi:hypothetical protein